MKGIFSRCYRYYNGLLIAAIIFWGAWGVIGGLVPGTWQDVALLWGAIISTGAAVFLYVSLLPGLVRFSDTPIWKAVLAALLHLMIFAGCLLWVYGTWMGLLLIVVSVLLRWWIGIAAMDREMKDFFLQLDAELYHTIMEQGSDTDEEACEDEH